jgi:cytochrome c oxidase subunit IV
VPVPNFMNMNFKRRLHIRCILINGLYLLIFLICVESSAAAVLDYRMQEVNDIGDAFSQRT